MTATIPRATIEGATIEGATDGGATASVPRRSPVARSGSLSPTRAADFKVCPLLYRFRSVDRLPQTPSSAAVRGTVVHRALEQVFDVPATRRTLEHATSLLSPALAEVIAGRPEVAELFRPPADAAAGPGSGAGSAEPTARWLAEAGRLVGRWFELEDPTRL